MTRRELVKLHEALNMLHEHIAGLEIPSNYDNEDCELVEEIMELVETLTEDTII